MKQPNMFKAIGEILNRHYYQQSSYRGVHFWDAAGYLIYASLFRVGDLAEELFKGYFATFKPYKEDEERKRDVAQPARGLFNILKGLVGIVATLVLIVSSTILTLIAIFSPVDRFFRYHDGNPFAAVALLVPALLTNLLVAAARLIENLALIVQGSIQVLSSPVTWLLKVPFRSLLTSILGAPKIEENPGMKKLITEVMSNEKCPVTTYHEIHRKFRKEIERGQSTEIINENTRFQELERAKNRLGWQHLANYNANPTRFSQRVRSGELAREENNNNARNHYNYHQNADAYPATDFQGFDNAVTAYHRLFVPAAIIPNQDPPPYQPPVAAQANNALG